MKHLIGKLLGKVASRFAETPKSIFSKDIIKSSSSEFGDYTYGDPEIFEWGEGKRLIVGKFCSIAGEVKIFLGGGHRVDWITTYPFNVLSDDFPLAESIVGHPTSKGDVIVGNDVWIGHGSTILSGVTIGDGAVIGAGSLVTRNVEPYSIVAGNPARFIKARFSDEDIKFLLRLQWWNWPIQEINKNVRLLCSSDIANLRRKFDH